MVGDKLWNITDGKSYSSSASLYLRFGNAPHCSEDRTMLSILGEEFSIYQMHDDEDIQTLPVI